MNSIQQAKNNDNKKTHYLLRVQLWREVAEIIETEDGAMRNSFWKKGIQIPANFFYFVQHKNQFSYLTSIFFFFRKEGTVKTGKIEKLLVKEHLE